MLLIRIAGALTALSMAIASPAVAHGGGHSAPPPPQRSTAPGAPGGPSTWTTGAKDGLGTSTTTASKVWFTLGSGAMNEVYYPRVDVADVTSLEVVVTDGRTFTDRESTDTTHRVRLLDRTTLSYQQIDTDRNGHYRIVKTYTTDPARSSVAIDVDVQPLDRGHYTAYILYDPSLANSGLHDNGSTDGSTLLASDTSGADHVASALLARPAFTAVSNGYAGTSDGWTDLADHHLDNHYTDAPDGNIVQIGQLAADRHGGTHATVVLGFGSTTAEAEQTAGRTASTSFGRLMHDYASGWASYLRSINRPPRSVAHDRRLLTQYDVAVMTLKAHEDKTYRGADIASLTIPWGQAVNADNAGVGGYHLVWARDLYEVATAELAAGDTAAANRSLDYLFDVQQKPDGSFPQNSLLDGTPYWGSLQLDEVAFPIVLAGQLHRYDATTWSHVKAAADFIVGHGPATPQERWEEEGGYSPSTIAAEIAGLVTAADLAKRQGDAASAGLYLATADDWQRHVEDWTVTTTGSLGSRYFMRIDDNTDPNDGHSLDINNGGGTYDERDIVDAGFLELVRLGVLPANDPAVLSSLPVVDSTIKVDTPEGPMWHRYNHDGYGEKSDGRPYDGTGVGRLWPLLSGERGEYELAAGQQASSYLRTMAGAANAGYMIPEQVWDQPSGDGFTFGQGTGSATPLAWSMAQFVRLARSVDAGSPVETPALVKSRYASGSAPQGPSLTLTSPADGLQTDAATATVSGATSATQVFIHGPGGTQSAAVSGGSFTAQVPLVLGRNSVTVAAIGANGGTALAQRTVISTNLGTPVGTYADPAGDDHGPGSYTYPGDGAFVPGAFDVTDLGVYQDSDNVNVAVTINGDVTNPWGGNQISVQRFDLYIASGGSGGAVAALPGTNADLAAPYAAVLTADGWSSTLLDAHGNSLGPVTLTAIPERHQIVASVPRSALAGIDLGAARYALTMMSHADPNGEGVGGVRPVYDGTYWASTVGTDMSWIHDFRFGGGAGEWTGDNAAHDTDTSDPNVLDILVPSGQSQGTVLDWRAGSPVVLPYVSLS